MTEQEFYIGQIFETLYPPEAATWCNENNAIIADLEDGGFKIVEAPIYVPTVEEQIIELQKYLNDTDWYAVRYAETGVEIPEEVKQKRQESREKISDLREEKS